MTVHLRRYHEIPVPPPPPATYDLLGLSEDEAYFLRDLLGRFPAYGDSPHKRIWKALTDDLGAEDARFTIMEGTTLPHPPVLLRAERTGA